MTPKSVAIAGGGMAGLAAAVRLTEAGYRVTLVEQRKRLGGRAHSFADPKTGDETDNGQHLFIGAYHETLALLETIGTAHLVKFQDRLEVPYRDPKFGVVWLRCPNLPAPLHLVFGALGLPSLSWRDKWALLKSGYKLLGLRWRTPAKLDEISAAQFLENLGHTPALRRAVWDPIIVATLNEKPENVSAFLLGEVLGRAFMRRRRDSMLGYSSVGLSQLYVEPAVKWLEARGATLQTGQGVTGLWSEGGRIAGLALSDGSAVEADAFLLALPPQGLAKLAQKEPLVDYDFFKRAGKIGSSPIVSVNLWLEKPLPLEGAFVGILESPIEWIFDRGAILGEGAEGRHPYCLVTSAARELLEKNNSEIAERCIEAVWEAYPEARGTKVVNCTVVKEPHATFSAPPGFEKLRCSQRTPIANLFLAGDWTDTKLPATLEAAADSATRAVREIRVYLDK